MKPAIGYIRTSEETESGLGLEAQRQRIVSCCKDRHWKLADIYQDAGISAGKPLAKRPAGARLLAEAKKSRPIIVIAKLDRAFRSVADASNTINALDRQGASIVSLAEGFDTTDSNPFARAMLQMVAIFAELERSLIRQRTRDAMGVKRKRGQRISRYAPYGHDFRGNRLVENPGEQKVLRLMRRERAAGRSWRGIAELLNRRGIPSKQGAPWLFTSVKSILSRPA